MCPQGSQRYGRLMWSTETWEVPLCVDSHPSCDGGRWNYPRKVCHMRRKRAEKESLRKRRESFQALSEREGKPMWRAVKGARERWTVRKGGWIHSTKHAKRSDETVPRAHGLKCRCRPWEPGEGVSMRRWQGWAEEGRNLATINSGIENSLWRRFSFETFFKQF